MYGCKLKVPKGLPKPEWACKTSVDNYSWINKNKKDMIEFSICTAKERTVIDTNGQRLLSGTGFSCLVGDYMRESFAEEGVRVDIASVAVSFGDLDYSMAEYTEEDLKDASVLLLPADIDELPKGELSELERLINRYIDAYAKGGSASEVLCSSIALELLWHIDSIARRKSLDKKDKYRNYYVKKADSIILERYSERLTLKLAASELGISSGYLSTLYKEAYGIAFSDRLFEVRIKKARELLLFDRLTAAEAAERVGFIDDSHLRKRFKQYYGVGIREYLCVANENTLYHRRPTAENRKEKGTNNNE